jgi:RNA polymerase sigma-B factor
MTHRRGRSDARLQRLQRRGDARARTELVERYLPLARKLALQYRNSGEPVEDLIQVASLGLVKALHRWDPDHGATFATFAMPTILGELRRYFRDTTWAVRPPRRVQELALVLGKAYRDLPDDARRLPTAAELAARVQRSEEDVLDALAALAAYRAESLDAPIAEGGEEGTVTALGEPEPGYARVEDEAMLEQMTRTLDKRSREALRLHFQEDLFQREIAERMGCSQTHASRLLRDALAKLRLAAAAPAAA